MEPITNQTVQQTPPKKKSLSQWAIARKKFIRNMPAMASLIFLLVVTALSMASPLLSDIDPSRINPRLVKHRLLLNIDLVQIVQVGISLPCYYMVDGHRY